MTSSGNSPSRSSRVTSVSSTTSCSSATHVEYSSVMLSATVKGWNMYGMPQTSYCP